MELSYGASQYRRIYLLGEHTRLAQLSIDYMMGW